MTFPGFLIRVGHMRVCVRPMGADYEDLGDAKGVWLEKTATILINTALPAADQLATFFHELMHAIFSVYGVEDDGMTQERVCRALDVPLTAVLQSNTTLLAVLYTAVAANLPLFEAVLSVERRTERPHAGDGTAHGLDTIH